MLAYFWARIVIFIYLLNILMNRFTTRIFFFFLSIIYQTSWSQWAPNPYQHVPIYNSDFLMYDDSLGFFCSQAELIVWGGGRTAVQRRDSNATLTWSSFYNTYTAMQNNQQPAEFISDGKNGTLILSTTWGTNDALQPSLQRLDKNGQMKWGNYGVSMGSGYYAGQDFVPDGQGGCIVGWGKCTNPGQGGSIYINRLDSTGATKWGSGVQLASAGTYRKYIPYDGNSGSYFGSMGMASDGKGGAYVIWYVDMDPGGGKRAINLTRVNGTGVIVFTITVCGGNHSIGEASVIADKHGGVIVTWFDSQTSPDTYFGQHVDSLGNILWTSGGKQLTFTGDGNGGGDISEGGKIIPDSSGGFILFWKEKNKFVTNRFDKDGNPLWGANGMLVSLDTTSIKRWEVMTSDSAGGAIYGWRQGPLDTILTYGQRISVDGKRVWMADGLPICKVLPNSFGNQQDINMSVCPDGKNGGFFAWNMFGDAAHYCHRVYAEGILGLAPPMADLYILNKDTICKGGLTVNFENRSVNGSKYIIDFGDGTKDSSMLSKFSHTYAASGSYLVTLMAINSVGSDTVQGMIGTISAGFLQSTDTIFLYQGDSVQFTNASSGANQYQWIFGDGTFSSAASPLHHYLTPGVYNVTQIVQSLSCIDSAFNTVVVVGCAPTVDPAYIVTPTDTIFLCLGDTAFLHGLSSLSAHTWYLTQPDTIWYEGFSYPDGTVKGNGTPPRWTSYKTGGAPSSSWFKVNAGRMRGQRTEGEGRFFSESIPLSQSIGTTVIIDLKEFSNLDAADYIKCSYFVDNGPEQFFAVNGQVFGNFGSILASQNDIRGNFMTLKVVVHNNLSGSNDDLTDFDNVTITRPTDSILSHDSVFKYVPLQSSYVYLSEKNWSCTHDSVYVKIINKRPVVNAGNDVSICPGYITTLNASAPGTGNTYAWAPAAGLSNTTSPNPAASPTSTTTYTVITANSCGSDTDTVVVTVKPVPSVSISATATVICKGNTVTLSASGATTYIWKPGNQTSTAITVSPSSTTNYTVIGTQASCTATMTFTLKVNPSYMITQNANLCAGDSIFAGGEYQHTAGTYYDTLPTIQLCDSIIKQVVTVVTIDTSVTETQPVLTSNQTGAQYQWVDCNTGYVPLAGATAQTFTATATGSYAVIVTKSNCSDTSACKTITSTNFNPTIPSVLYLYTDQVGGLVTINASACFNLVVTNALGQKLLSAYVKSKNTSVDLNTQPAGIYFLQIIFTDGTCSNRKVIVR